MRKVSFFVPLCMLGILAACTLEDLTPVQRNTICRALVKGIPYNTYNKESQRYAGMLLALDVKQHNQIWLALHCGKAPHARYKTKKNY